MEYQPMTENQAVQKILLEILKIGLLRIRHLGDDGSADACSIEADHLHNIPEVISSGSRDQLLYYYNVERPIFLKRAADAQMFQPQWEQLANWIEPGKR